MSNEIAQFREWDFASSVEWFLLDYEMHAKYQLFVARLNAFYLENAPLFELDDSWEGFSWIDADNSSESVASFIRRDKKGRELVVLINFTPVLRENFILSVPSKAEWVEVFNTDDADFGGLGRKNPLPLKSFEYFFKGYDEAISVTLPPLSAVIFEKKK